MSVTTLLVVAAAIVAILAVAQERSLSSIAVLLLAIAILIPELR